VPCSQDSSEHGYFPGFHDHDAVAQSFAGFLVGTGRGEPGVVRFGS
jgi:crotonobetainyl-CoA:carnitine CoA-transferase CaiB-like acyl-CoA transferase